MYAWTLLTEVNCQPGTGEKKATVFYYVCVKVWYSI